jgi:hypothetical protein
MHFYIAGPMRGRQYFNFPAFDAARDALLALGHRVTSPADLDRAHGFDAMDLDPSDPCDGVPDGFCDGVPDGFCLKSCITRDVAAILDTAAVCFIDEAWRHSTGCVAEYHVARWAGKKTYELVAGEPVEVCI